MSNPLGTSFDTHPYQSRNAINEVATEITHLHDENSRLREDNERLHGQRRGLFALFGITLLMNFLERPTQRRPDIVFSELREEAKIDTPCGDRYPIILLDEPPPQSAQPTLEWHGFTCITRTFFISYGGRPHCTASCWIPVDAQP